MSSIYELTELDNVQPGDFLVVYSLQNGETRKTRVSDLAEMLRDFSANRLKTEYAAPGEPGFEIHLPANSHLILTPSAELTNGEFFLPNAPRDRDEVLISNTEPVNNIQVDGNGRNVIGAPEALTRNAFFRLKYDAVTLTWYRVG